MIQRYKWPVLPAGNGPVEDANGDVCFYTDHLAALAEKEEELFAARQAILAGGIREGELKEQIEEQNNILNPGEYISEQVRNGVAILVLRKDLWDVTLKKEK